MKHRMFLLLPLLALASCERDAPAEVATAAPSPEPAVAVGPREHGAEFPALKLPALDGSTYDLAARRGKWVVVNFWATWCAPCLKEMPELDALDKARDDLEVVGLAYDEIAPEDMKAFLKERPVAYPVVIIDTFNPPADFATPRGLPMTYLIAPDGRALEPFLGPVTAKEIEDAIAAHSKDRQA